MSPYVTKLPSYCKHAQLFEMVFKTLTVQKTSLLQEDNILSQANTCLLRSMQYFSKSLLTLSTMYTDGVAANSVQNLTNSKKVPFASVKFTAHFL